MHRFTRLRALSVLAALAVHPVQAGPRATARVLDAEDGRPIAGAVVTVKGSDIMAVTDTGGRCPLSVKVGPGTLVTALKNGYFADTTRVRRSDSDGGLVVELSMHRDLPRFVLGVVTDSFGRQPLVDATVTVDGTGLVMQTSADGAFVFPLFPYGPQVVRAECEGYRAGMLSVSARGGETTRVDFALHDTANTGTLEGTVTESETGQPIAGVIITVSEAGWQATSDSAGCYLLERIPAGVHRLVAFGAGFRRGTTRFRVVRGWSVTVNLRLQRGEQAKGGQ